MISVQLLACVMTKESCFYLLSASCCILLQEIGYAHMRIAEGVQSLLQMSGLLARLCHKSAQSDQLQQ